MKPSTDVVCLVGSTRFRKEFDKANLALSTQGKVVLSLGWFDGGGGVPTPAEEEVLRSLHYRKLDLCSEVFVVNPGGHIGPYTHEEILYAISKYKPVRFLVDTPHNGTFHTVAQVALLDAPRAGSRWQHYKGGKYTVLICSVAEDTLEPLVTYSADKYGFAMTRRLSVWAEEVEGGDGRPVPRFRPLPPGE